MKIYLAGSCDIEHRTIMAQIARILREYGKFEVYCPWKLKIENAWDISQEEWAQKVFEADIKAIQHCDIFFMISQGRKSTAGTNWENGYAYALNKQIIIIQINDNPTSLMTFCSASNFFVCDKDNYYNIIQYICNNLNDYNMVRNRKTVCKTILT